MKLMWGRLRAMVDQQGANIAECLAFCSQLLANLVRLKYLKVEFDLGVSVSV